MKRISIIALSRLSHDEAYTFLKRTESMARSLLTDPADGRIIDEFSASFAAFEECYLAEVNHPCTTQAAEAAARLDDLWRGFRHYVAAMRAHPAAATAAAASALADSLTPYADITALGGTSDPASAPAATSPNDRVTMATLRATLAALPEATVAALHLDEWQTPLAEAIEAYVSTHRAAADRRPAASLRHKRRAVDGAFQVFIESINALAVFRGDAAYAPFINQLNALVNHVRTIVNSHTARPVRPSAFEYDED